MELPNYPPKGKIGNSYGINFIKQLIEAAKKKQRRKRERFNGNEPRQKSQIGKEKKKGKYQGFC